jgi:hypothetical protein
LNVSPFDAFNERAYEYARDRGAELVGMKYDEDGNLVQNPNARWAITDTTRNDLRDLETKAFEQGWSPTELKARVNDLIDDPARAKMIADTELSDAQMQGALAEAKESGLVSGKGVLLSNVHDIDDDCDQAEADGVIPLDDNFSIGEDAPPFHGHCDCDLYFEVIGADE